MTGFGDAEYYGPYGMHENRTSSARGARTVDYDVVRNEASQYNASEEPVKTAQAVRETEEETVAFKFDQPEE
jgi:hypothetical protein